MQKRKKFSNGRRPSSAGINSTGTRKESARTTPQPTGPGHAQPVSGRTERRPHHRASLRKPAGGDLWLYGTHAVSAALENPARQAKRLLVIENALEAIRPVVELATSDRRSLAVETVGRAEIDALFPSDTVHQGVALLTMPLNPPTLEDVLDDLGTEEHALVVILDQAADPRNVGAVLRSAAAFGASALILPERHAPPESGALAKAASGALELIPLVRVTNIARTLDTLKTGGFWCIGLAPEGGRELSPPAQPSRVALVLGAEGGGLRRLTLERCDDAARIPLAGPIASLNLSAAAAIALFAYRTCVRTKPA